MNFLSRLSSSKIVFVNSSSLFSASLIQELHTAIKKPSVAVVDEESVDFLNQGSPGLIFQASNIREVVEKLEGINSPNFHFIFFHPSFNLSTSAFSKNWEAGRLSYLLSNSPFSWTLISPTWVKILEKKGIEHYEVHEIECGYKLVDKNSPNQAIILRTTP